jgi:single-strand DNA-binding protein
MAFTESKVTVVGRLGADPESRATSGGKSLLELRVCANVYRGKDKEETPVWFKVTVWEKYAEALANSGMSKGDLCYVSGDLILEDYTTKDGEVRNSLVILNATVIPMSGRERPSGQRQSPREESRGGRSAGSPFRR